MSQVPSQPIEVDAEEHIEFSVESLEFEGLDVREPQRVQAAFQGELTRLLQNDGLPERAVQAAAGAAYETAALSATDMGSPERIGVAVARNLYAELSR